MCSVGAGGMRNYQAECWRNHSPPYVSIGLIMLRTTNKMITGKMFILKSAVARHEQTHTGD